MSDPVRVRMYNVGFGDCFLIEAPTGDSAPFRVLVDCGAHSLGYPEEGWRPEDVVDRIIADITVEGEEPHLDVVVATHRHADHVVGFRSPAWAGVRVGEVWMPWTEDPNDADATSLRERQHRLALGLDSAIQSQAFQQRWSNAERVSSLSGMVANSLTNEKAMSTLHNGFRGRPRRRFLESPATAPITLGGCPGLRVHVLGPSRDERVIRDMDPPAGQSYLRFLDEIASAAPDPEDMMRQNVFEQSRWTGVVAHRPFPRSFTFPPDAYEARWQDLGAAAEVKEAARSIMRGDDAAAAVALDKAVNGTSLMLMFELGEAFLLFPGDAQWGTWRAALDHPPSRELLARTTFYKIGHHGSHNATPREFVEDVVGAKMWGAVASVHPVARWPEIPKADLLKALDGQAERIVRSDAPGRSGKGVSVRRKVGVDFLVPTSS